MAIPIQLRRDTSENWALINPTLSEGELAYETDTGKMKIGNGSATWTSLAYLVPGSANAYTFGTTAPTGTAPSNGLYFQY